MRSRPQTARIPARRAVRARHRRVDSRDPDPPRFHRSRGEGACRWRIRFVLLLPLAAVLLPVRPCRAGAWDGAVLGPRASTMATAFTGLADDPSAIFYNAAGLALLERKQGLAASIRYNASTLTYRFPEGRTSPAGRTEGKSYLTGFLPDVFYYRKFGRFAAGIGLYVPYGGLAGEWDPDVFGVDMSQFMAIASVTPSVAWAITPKLSIGAGLNIYYGYMKSKVIMEQIPVGMFGPLLPPEVGGIVDLLDLRYLPLKLRQGFVAKGASLGFNAGILYRPFDFLSLGFSVRSGSDVTLSGSSDIVVYLLDPLSVYLHSDLDVSFKLPYLFTFGVAVRPLPQLVVVADVHYGAWSRLSEIRLNFQDLGFTQVNPTGYEDVVTFMIGLEYAFLDHWTVRAGYKRFPSNIEDHGFLSYQSWDTNMNTFSFGLGYGWGNVSLHAIAMVSVGDWATKQFDDPIDPIGKPRGGYTNFYQTYGLGVLWYF